MKSEVFNADCMEVMALYPDKYFDLAVVDVPYGICAASKEFMRVGIKRGNSKAIGGLYKVSDWDSSVPDGKYWNELFRVSQNQIIWGANHFISMVPNDSSCWIVWDKENGNNGYADCELAYTSFGTAVRRFRFKWHGMLQQDMKNKEQRIHPTQKPVALYDWIYKNYLPNGGRVIDTHLGSGSNRIAADKAGNIEFTACEIDKDYFDAQERRYKDYKAQGNLFRAA